MTDHSRQLISSLQNPLLYGHPVSEIEIIETHISWVILTGAYAYKIKKPLDLGFLDFSTLAKRKYFCQRELELNKRLAPDYYLNVISVSGSYESPCLNDEGNGNESRDVIEYMLKMVQFPQENQLDRELAAGNLGVYSMYLVAEKIADFHDKINVAHDRQSFGDLSHVHQPVLNCYAQILTQIKDTSDILRVKKLQDWSSSTFSVLTNTFIARKEQGFVRECHGDLHLRNIAIVESRVIAFDCIEFSDDLRWNDLMSEVAFLVMDLDDHQQPVLANAFLNRYLELTGDYAGLAVFRYYLVYRAIVRAMVSCIRLSQEDIALEERNREYTGFLKYLDLAETYTVRQKPKLFIMHGLSGSGKTTVSQIISQTFSVIRVRSDIERKRLSGLHESQRDFKGVGKGIYSAESSQQTYRKLYELAGQLLDANFSVIVDATFLKRSQRKMFQQLAKMHSVDYVLVHCFAERQIMESRLEKRKKQDVDASDADLAVLQNQINQDEHFSAEEKISLVEINTENDIVAQVLRKL